METKICTSCKQELSLENFNQGTRYKDGYRSQCKECKNKAEKERYEKTDEFLDRKVGDDKYRNWLINWHREFLDRQELKKSLAE
jgi:hypothetical protein